MNTRAWEAVNILRDYGFRIPDDIIDNLYRVLKTKEIVGGGETDADQVYAVMQNETEYKVGRFPGDAVLFNRVYRALSSLDTHEIFYLLNASNGERELVVPSVLAEKFAEQITEETRSVMILSPVTPISDLYLPARESFRRKFSPPYTKNWTMCSFCLPISTVTDSFTNGLTSSSPSQFLAAGF